MSASDSLPPPAGPALKALQDLCPMRTQIYRFGGEELTLWTACDIDPLLNSLLDKDPDHPDVQDERMPYWAELWPSSLLLAETIYEHRHDLPSGTWLELGCGPGLPGLMAARLGRNGVSSDYMEEALQLVTLNAYQNDCRERITPWRLDWRDPPSDKHFEWILAGDIAYETRNFEPLYTAFESLTTAQGEIWIGEPGRSVAVSFFEGLRQRGWKGKVLAKRDGITLHRYTRYHLK